MLNTTDLPVPFEVRLEPHRERLMVVASGELDLHSADRWEAAVLEQFDSGFQHVVADLRELSFIDSSGIRVLWRAHQRSERGDTRFSVIPGDGEVSRALRITGLLERMHLLER
ncbi:MAG: anti-sigma factor antagonist [Solirubrobacteraceae bacterium]|jgi:anti-sigma B factor antagonist|nr:anti-sigma factor antagonist [Solirubrobacteraceae bacterium]